jgi:HNH endonuclease
MPQSCTVLPHELDHIRAQKHRGPTQLENLCWACALCNSHKGTDAAAFVPGTEQLVRLFNPRTDAWQEHFAWAGPKLLGRTEIGLATIELLQINASSRVHLRQLLIEAKLFPPVCTQD